MLQIRVDLDTLVEVVTQPTFLVGAEQSGTTLLRLMLDSHPEIAFAEDFGYVVAGVSGDGTLPTSTEFTSRLDLNPAFAASGFAIDDSLPFEDLVTGFLHSRQRQKGALHVGATIHHHFSRALTIWPDARFIHVVRDPRDVAPARVRQGFAGNVWHALDSWVRVEDEWTSLAERLPAERYMTVRFSDLVADHHSTLTGVCRFFGVDYTSQMLDYARDTDYQEPSKSLAGDWRLYLDDRDVQLIEARVGHRLSRSGFEPSGLPSVELGDRERTWLRRQDRFGRTWKRFGSYGVRLTVADFAARAIGNEGLQESLRFQIDQVERSRKKSWSDQAKYRTSR